MHQMLETALWLPKMNVGYLCRRVLVLDADPDRRLT